MMLEGLAPLAEIESRVQARAKSVALDLDDASTEAALRHFLTEEVDEWNRQHLQGLRSFELTQPEQLIDVALRNLTGYGPLAPLLDDEMVWEIMINAPDAIFVKRHRGPSGYHHEVFHDDAHVERVLARILHNAAGAHRTLDPSEGLQDAQLEDGSRLHIVHRDIGQGRHAIVNIRKFGGLTYRSLDQLVAHGTLTATAANFLRAAVHHRATIVFAGSPGAGKTTLLSCCAAELDPSLRVVVAEEVFEAGINLPNVASMQTRAARADRPAVDLRRLVAGFLRMAPDVAVVGEVRDQEALPLLLTLSSGVTGYTTIHAGSASQALTRLRFICQLAETHNELPVSALNHLISESIDLVVFSERTPDGPRVAEILAVETLTSGAESPQFTTTEVFDTGETGALDWSGAVPARLALSFARDGVDLRSLLEPGSP